MAKRKKNKDTDGVVYSTNPDYQYQNNPFIEAKIPPENQNLKVWLEKKGGGKVTTIIREFIGPEDEMKDLGKLLKQKCGVGGNVKDRDIIIQGDHRDKVIAILAEQGYPAKKAGA